MTQLQAGKTLAQVADATSGKSTAGLIDALVAAEKTELASAVTAGTITQAQSDQIATTLKARVHRARQRHGPAHDGGPAGCGRASRRAARLPAAPAARHAHLARAGGIRTRYGSARADPPALLVTARSSPAEAGDRLRSRSRSARSGAPRRRSTPRATTGCTPGGSCIRR